ncbi:hypothetical protein [Allohahella sp. A8]|uniref:AbiU2 domain-containing protein n=1 Tax=Allohahella sp. A8 TaxID=3141461 RepID=UPI003A807532
MDRQLLDAFEAVRDSVNASRGHYQIWYALRARGKAIDQYFDEMNDYRFRDFFLAANIGHFKLMFVEIACLFDSGGGSHSVRNLKCLIRANGYGGLAKNFEKQLKPFGSLVSNIKTVRSKVIAHKDIGVNEKDLYQKHGIKPDEIKVMLDTVASLMRELETVITGDASCHSVGSSDKWEISTYKLLETLRIARNP